MDAHRVAFNTWQEKTEWVQKDKRFDVLLPWGKHRADVLKEYIDHLEAKCAALASPEAEAVGVVRSLITIKDGLIRYEKYYVSDLPDGDYELFTAPPAPVSVPAGYRLQPISEYDAMCSAMLQGTEPVTTDYKLPDDFDFDRFNDVTWLEAVASNPHMHSPTTSTIAMVALELNKRLEACNSPVVPDGLVMVPVELAPEQIRAVQLNSELGAYAAANLTGAYSLFRELWDVAIAAAPQQEVKP